MHFDIGQTRRVFLQRAAVGFGGLLGMLTLACSPASPAAEPTARTVGQSVATTVATAKPTPAGAPPPVKTDPTVPAKAQPESGLRDLKGLEAAAKSEGRVMVYAALVPEIQDILRTEFLNRYGIEMDSIRLNTGPLAQRYAAEAETDNVVADVLQHNDPVFFNDAVQKGWISKINDLPALTQWPKEHWSGTYATISVNEYYVGFNTDFVKPSEAPRTWPDLLDPKWKGKMFFIDPRNTAAVLALLHFCREQYGDDFLRRLAAQDLRLVASGVPGAQQLAAGAAHLMAPANSTAILPLAAQGAPVALTSPMEPSTGAEQIAGVSTKAPHPNAARLFLNFLMSSEGQAVLVKFGYSSVLPNVPGAKPLPKSYRSPKVKEALAVQSDLLRLVGIQ